MRPGLAALAGTAALGCLTLFGAGPATAAEAPEAPPEQTTKLRIINVKLNGNQVKRGEALKVQVVLKNTGDSEAKKVEVCARVPKNKRKGIKAKPRCKSPGKIDPGAKRRLNFRLKITPRLKGKTVVTFRAASANAGKAKSTLQFNAPK
ncbi:MAG: hypothetical protein ACERKT_04000 [Acidobacteriota bacterium]